MLTYTDIHYLVGILTLASSPETVEVELGSMVYDEHADEDRDVDVTVSWVNADGERMAFVGREVKAHKRPLDVGHVEQLCIKLADMPAITHRSIVSASGYTEGAKRKAAGHGVDLFQLKPWVDIENTFDFVKMTADTFVVEERKIDWVSPPNLRFLFPVAPSEEEEKEFQDNPPLVDASGNPSEWGPTARSCLEKVLPQAELIICNDDKVKLVPDGVDHPVTMSINLENRPEIVFATRRLPIQSTELTGTIRWMNAKKTMDFRMLVKEGEEKPVAACAVTLLHNGDLFGLQFIPSLRGVGPVRVSLSERNKEKIRRHQLRLNVQPLIPASESVSPSGFNITASIFGTFQRET